MTDQYSHIFKDETLSSAEKLAAFTTAAGWTPELEEWLAYSQMPAIPADNTTQSLLKTFGLGGPADNSTTTPSKYTDEENAAFEQQYTAYRDTYAANYQATAAFAGRGSGTPADPYIITNRAQLEAIANDLSASYKLGNDIDLRGSSNPWTPIGTQAAPFTGILDGDGFAIYIHNINPLIAATNADYGFMGYGIGATIKSVQIDYDDQTITQQNQQYMVFGGIIVGADNCRIDQCRVSANINYKYTANKYPQTGGIVGYCTGGGNVVSNCVSDFVTRDTSSAKQSSRSGGVAGFTSYNIATSNTYTMGSLYVESAYTTSDVGNGGIMGVQFNNAQVSISNSVSLMSSITTVGILNAGRIIASGNGLLTSNYADTAMQINGVTVSGGTTTNKNGANVDASTYHTQAYWQNTLGWDFNTIWYWDTTEQLPKLRAFVHGPTITNVGATPTTGGVTTEITLSATVTGATTMQWQSSTDSGTTWQNVPGATTATATWTPAAAGSYQVRLHATNADGTTTSDSITVTITSTSLLHDKLLIPYAPHRLDPLLLHDRLIGIK